MELDSLLELNSEDTTFRSNSGCWIFTVIAENQSFFCH